VPRLYHSASSLKLGNPRTGCEAAWGHNYLLGQRAPEIPWEEFEADPDTECTTSQRSTSLGKAMHSVGEAWYRTEAKRVAPKLNMEPEPPNWQSLPGKVFHSGAHLLPHPHRCSQVWVESAIGDQRMPDGASAHAPPTRMRFGGIYLAGYIDLIARIHSKEVDRLGIPSDLALIDYKSCKTMNYALTPETLPEDLAAAIYTWWACEKFDVPRIFARWPYFETGKIRRATPVDSWLTKSKALEVIEPYHDTALRLDTLEGIEQCEKNTDFCGAYGGCPYHRTAGGDCDARRPLGKLIANIRKKKPMPISKEQKAAFAAARNKAGKGKPAEPKTVAVAEKVQATPKPRRPRPSPAGGSKKRGSKKPSLAALSTSYEELEVKLVSARAEHEAAEKAVAAAAQNIEDAETALDTVRNKIQELLAGN